MKRIQLSLMALMTGVIMISLSTVAQANVDWSYQCDDSEEDCKIQAVTTYVPSQNLGGIYTPDNAVFLGVNGSPATSVGGGSSAAAKWHVIKLDAETGLEVCSDTFNTVSNEIEILEIKQMPDTNDDHINDVSIVVKVSDTRSSIFFVNGSTCDIFSGFKTMYQADGVITGANYISPIYFDFDQDGKKDVLYRQTNEEIIVTDL